MSTNVTLHAGHDVAYFTSGQGRGGCAGAMSYYTAAGEPPGEWAGKGAAALGLSGQVDPNVIGRLYQHNIGPGGELLVKPRQSKAAAGREQVAVAAYLAAHPYASATELAEVRAAERGKEPHQVPYFDLTVSAVKSVSRVSDILCAGLFPVRFRVFIRNRFLALSAVVLPGLSRGSAEPDFPCRSGADAACPGYRAVLLIPGAAA